MHLKYMPNKISNSSHKKQALKQHTKQKINKKLWLKEHREAKTIILVLKPKIVLAPNRIIKWSLTCFGFNFQFPLLMRCQWFYSLYIDIIFVNTVHCFTYPCTSPLLLHMTQAAFTIFLVVIGSHSPSSLVLIR